MKKDIFNGKIKKEYVGLVKLGIILGALIFALGGILFLCISLLYTKIELAARVAMYVVSGVCFALSIAFPLATVLCARSYPKHKILTKIFLKPYVFVTDDSKNEFPENK